MTPEKEDKIRRRAYELWEQEGCPHGRAWDHWVQAAREVEAEEGGHANSGEAEIPPMPEDFPQAEQASSTRSRRNSGTAKNNSNGTAKRTRKST